MNEQAPKGSKLLMLALADVVADLGVQPREAMCPRTVADYEELLRAGVEMPPLVVFHSGGKTYLLASGFHRLPAARQAGMRHYPCHVLPGGLREAALFAAGTNATHGLPRSPGDKRRAVHMVLNDPEGKDWPAERVAQHCGVSVGLVKALKVSSPWKPAEGLFGPVEGETPPPPDHATEGRGDDREQAEERMFRAGRKFFRLADAAGLSHEAAVEAVRADLEARRERDRRTPRARPEAPVVPGPPISMHGTI